MHKRAVGSLAVILVCVLVLVGMILVQKPDSIFASGLEIIGGDFGLTVDGQAPLFSLANMAPGDWEQSSLTVSNQGRHDFSFSISAEEESGDSLFFQHLQIVVTGPDTTYYSGPISNLTALPITTLISGEAQELTLAVGLSEAAGNLIQGSLSSITFIIAAEQHRRYDIHLAAKPMTGGNVAGNGIYDHGAGVALSAAPYTGYEFVYYLEDLSLYSIFESNYDFVALDDRNLEAVFWEVSPTTQIRQVDFDTHGEGLAVFDYLYIDILGGDFGPAAVIGVTAGTQGESSAPAGLTPVGLSFSIQGSENLGAAESLIAINYYGILPLPEDVSEDDLILCRWNEATSQWELAGSEQGVNVDDKDVWAIVEDFGLFALFYETPGYIPVTGTGILWLLPLGLIVLVIGLFLTRRLRCT